MDNVLISNLTHKLGLAIDTIKRQNNLIERQKAEIEQLKKQKQLFEFSHKNQGDLLWGRNKEVKSEAIMEFADRLKIRSQLLAPSVYAEPCCAVTVEDIDIIAEEMTEDKSDFIVVQEE